MEGWTRKNIHAIPLKISNFDAHEYKSKNEVKPKIETMITKAKEIWNSGDKYEKLDKKKNTKRLIETKWLVSTVKLFIFESGFKN